MTTTRIHKGLHGQVLETLGMRIVRGPWGPGTSIDVDALVIELDVSRTTVREALKSLTDKGLVGARPRVGTYVLDRDRWNFLDVDVMAWRAAEPLDPSLVDSLTQVRAILEPGAARLAATMRTLDDAELLSDAMVRLESSVSEGPEAMASADLVVHRRLLAATHNELLHQFEVVLEPALFRRHSTALSTVTDLSFIDLHRDVVDAVVAGDPDAAEAAMHRLLRGAKEDIGAALAGGTVGHAGATSAP